MTQSIEIKLQKKTPLGIQRREILLALIEKAGKVSAYDLTKQIREQALFGKCKNTYQTVHNYLVQLVNEGQIEVAEIVKGESPLPKKLYKIVHK